MLPNGAEAALLQLAVAGAGRVLVPLNPRLPTAEVARVAAVTEARVVYVPTDRAGEVTGAVADHPSAPRVVASRGRWEDLLVGADRGPVALAASSADALAQIQFTSGTSGPPKGVLVTHGAMTATARLFVDRLGRDAGPWLNPMPMFHTAGNVLGSLGALTVGAHHVAVPFSPSGCVRLLADTRASVLSAAPALLELCLAELDGPPLDLRLVFTGGQRLSEQQVRHLEQRLGARVVVTFGMTETCGSALVTSVDDPAPVRRGGVGTPLPGTQARLVGPDGTPLDGPARGELQLRGERVARGYLVGPGEVRPALDDDGWLHTGDLAERAEDGTYRIVGRSSDMIKSGGENVTPDQVEAVLVTDPQVREAAVVGVPDQRWGEVVVGCLVLEDGAVADEVTRRLDAAVVDRLAPHARPRRWWVLDALPRTASSKVQRAELRARLASSTPSAERP